MTDPGTPDAPPIEVGAFKRALSRYATGVTIVSTRLGNHDHAMTANSFTGVSLDPALVLFCVEQDARFHDAVIDSGVFGVSILAAGQRSVATWLATQGRPLFGQLDSIPHEHGPRGAALITGAVAHLEAAVEGVHAAGDHSIIVGRVHHLAASDDSEAGLLYVRSRYAAGPGAY